MNLNDLLKDITPENKHEDLFADYPAKISVCKCSQCRSKKKNMRDRKAVKLFKRQASKKRRTVNNKHIHFTWA